MIKRTLWVHLLSTMLSASFAAGALPEIAWNELSVGQKLGQGGFGEVYAGTWRGLDVAVKRLTLRTLTGDEKTDFEKETQAMWKCQFTNVLRLVGVCKEDNHYAMVVELMRGGSLYDRLRREGRVLSEKERWDIAIRVAQGLADLHDRTEEKKQVIHGDLKSPNILLDEHGRARIADFGLVRIRSTTTATMTGGAGGSTASTTENLVGSTRWRAPECCQYPPRITDLSDIYSYGMILWELLTGDIPFHLEHNEKMVREHIKDGTREAIPADCPPVWKEIIESCWEQNPAQRPSAAEILERLTAAREPLRRSVWLPAPSPSPIGAIGAGGYRRYPGVYEDWITVIKNYVRRPVNGYDVANVEVVWNPSMNAKFESNMKMLQQHRGNPRYVVDWTKTTEGPRRLALQQGLRELKAPYMDYEAEDCPDVQLMPLWHGTQEEKLSSLLSAGYNAFRDTDDGYFGKGTYMTPEAEYANRCLPAHQANGRLVLNWGVSYNTYPILDVDYNADHGRLVGSVPPECDMRYIPVVQTAPGSQDYRPTKPGEEYDYREFMTANYGQVLPRYVVTLSKSLGEVDWVSSQDQIMFKAVRMPEALLGAYLRADQRFRDHVGQEAAAEMSKIIQEEAAKRAARLALEQQLRWSREAVAIISSVRTFIPEIVRGHEEVYLRFLRSKLIYKPNTGDDDGRREFPIASLWDPLSGTFDIRGCGDSDKYLSISTGFRAGKNPANKDKLEIWIVPQFVLQKDPRAKPYNDFLQKQESHRGKPFAVLFNWGGWKGDDYDHGVTGVAGREFDNLEQTKLCSRRSVSSCMFCIGAMFLANFFILMSE